MKQNYKRLAISLFLIFIFSKQSFSSNSGHMLDKFEFLEEGEIPMLSFNGFFETNQFLNIQINPDNENTKTIILIPNSYINDLLLSKRVFDSFSEDSLLKKITLTEDITRKENGEIFSKVKIIVTTKDKHLIEFDPENSDDRRLTFSMQDVKNKFNNEFEEIGINTPQTFEKNLGVLNNDHRKTILLHPITALMSYRKFDQIKISVLNASTNQDAAQKLVAVLVRQQKKNIEKRIGMNLKVVNISSVNQKTILPKTKLYFHPNFLRAAMILAEIIPGEQILEPFPKNRKSKISNDVQIYVGKNFE